MKKEAMEFYHAHGGDSIRLLKEEIWRALADKDDDRALDLDQMLYEIEQFMEKYGGSKH